MRHWVQILAVLLVVFTGSGAHKVIAEMTDSNMTVSALAPAVAVTTGATDALSPSSAETPCCPGEEAAKRTFATCAVPCALTSEFRFEFVSHAGTSFDPAVDNAPDGFVARGLKRPPRHVL